MENINSVQGALLHQTDGSQKEFAAKQAFGLVFKEILNDVIKEDNEIEDSFKSDEEKEVSSGFTSNLSAFSGELLDSFIKTPQAQRILNQTYEQYSYESRYKLLSS